MKRVCLRCNVISQDFNLWCQEKYCPAESATEIFDNGEWFGPIEIVQPIVILRSAIIYQARRGDEDILVKIANTGCEEKLRQEAKAFLQLAKAGQHPLLPILLPAHPQGSIDFHPYGWTVIRGQVMYYEVFRYAEGEVLRTLLLKNPQPWYQHAGWITLSIADVVYYLHRTGKLHLCLNPDVILVRYDRQGIPRPILLDLGISSPPQEVKQIWNDDYTLPAYTAPEIIDPNAASAIGTTSDVYGLGMLLYEMLAGKPTYQYHLKKDQAIYRNVLAGDFKPTGRIDLKNVPDIAEKAINRQSSLRFPDVMAFANALRPNFPPIPAERKSFKINWRIVFIVLGSLMVISLLVLFALSLVPQ
jgi:serine/threonine protein kinase